MYFFALFLSFRKITLNLFMFSMLFIFFVCFLLTGIPLYGYITVCLSIRLWMDIWFVSSIWLSQIKLQCIFMYKPLYGFSL